MTTGIAINVHFTIMVPALASNLINSRTSEGNGILFRLFLSHLDVFHFQRYVSRSIHLALKCVARYSILS